jgi:N-formylglutamate amidohydrolase
MRAVLFLLLPSLALAQAPTDKLLTIKPGTLPIILTAPHDGTLSVPGVPKRKGDGITKFVVVRDTGTAPLVELLADAIEKKMGGRPYVVIARFSRQYIDANRDPKNAYESKKAKPVYDAYHAAIEDAKKAIVKKWGRGILLDIHGQGAENDTVFRGTNDTKTVKHLIGRSGRGALIGPKSILGVMEKKGVKVKPACASTDKEDRRYSGGYTVQHHGSRDGGSIDAIQLELGSALRLAKGRPRTAELLAEAVAVFAKEFLPAKKVKR